MGKSKSIYYNILLFLVVDSEFKISFKYTKTKPLSILHIPFLYHYIGSG